MYELASLATLQLLREYVEYDEYDEVEWAVFATKRFMTGTVNAGVTVIVVLSIFTLLSVLPQFILVSCKWHFYCSWILALYLLALFILHILSLADVVLYLSSLILLDLWIFYYCCTPFLFRIYYFSWLLKISLNGFYCESFIVISFVYFWHAANVAT